MADNFLLALAIGFAVVVGATGFVWFRNGRDPRSPDDPSLLATAPPAGMTAATATLVLDRPTHEAFIAALLDLATRDEIRFESEGVENGADRVGIAIRGGESDDPRVLLNRRLPIGEAETWLLAQLRLAVTGRDHVDPAVAQVQGVVAGIVGGAQLAQTLMRVEAATGEGDDRPAARAAREPGLDPLSSADPDGLNSPQADPGAPPHDPQRGRRQDYISAARARTLGEPFMFGTLLGTYAKRHGWTAGVTGIRRAKWRLIGIGEIALGMVIAVIATNVFSEGLIGLATGIGLAGGVTYMVAPSMAARTREGARMRTQLMAYARTLRATFAGAATLDDAVAGAGLRWLASADQAVVWGMALGLRPEIEALLARSMLAAGPEAAAASAPAPAWFMRDRRRSPGAAPTTGDPETMFAGIELIGSEAMHGMLPGTSGGTPGLTAPIPGVTDATPRLPRQR